MDWFGMEFGSCWHNFTGKMFLHWPLTIHDEEHMHFFTYSAQKWMERRSTERWMRLKKKAKEKKQPKKEEDEAVKKANDEW